MNKRHAEGGSGITGEGGRVPEILTLLLRPPLVRKVLECLVSRVVDREDLHQVGDGEYDMNMLVHGAELELPFPLGIGCVGPDKDADCRAVQVLRFAEVDEQPPPAAVPYSTPLAACASGLEGALPSCPEKRYKRL